MTIGSPPKYSDPADMQKAIDEYFDKCQAGRSVTIIKKGMPTTFNQRIPKTDAGLALALGFASRQSLHDYCKRNNHNGDKDKKQAFAYIITCARLTIEADQLEGAAMGEYESKITQLNLSTNYKYSTKQELTVKPETDSLSDQELDQRIESKLDSMGLITRADQPKLSYTPIDTQLDDSNEAA